jgi:hypothetical protein
MKNLLCAAAIAALALPAFAQVKPCEELKAEIAARIEARGVTNYQLEIVPADQETDWKVVGTCAGGTMKIIYKRG